MFPVPTNLERLTDEVDGWLELRCPDKALTMLAPLLENPAARAAALWLRVRALVALAKHQEALVDLAELRPLAAVITDVRVRTEGKEWVELTEAWCKKRCQDLPGAIACMERLVAQQPKSAIGHFNLGCYLALAGQLPRAMDEVTIACGIDETLREILAEEPDLDGLHDDPRFAQLQKRSTN